MMNGAGSGLILQGGGNPWRNPRDDLGGVPFSTVKYYPVYPPQYIYPPYISGIHFGIIAKGKITEGKIAKGNITKG